MQRAFLQETLLKSPLKVGQQQSSPKKTAASQLRGEST